MASCICCRAVAALAAYSLAQGADKAGGRGRGAHAGEGGKATAGLGRKGLGAVTPSGSFARSGSLASVAEDDSMQVRQVH